MRGHGPAADRVRQAIEAMLPYGWTLIDVSARQLGSAGRVVAVVRWSGEHEMTVDIASVAGLEDAIKEMLEAFERLSYQAARAIR